MIFGIARGTTPQEGQELVEVRGIVSHGCPDSLDTPQPSCVVARDGVRDGYATAMTMAVVVPQVGESDAVAREHVRRGAQADRRVVFRHDRAPLGEHLPVEIPIRARREQNGMRLPPRPRARRAAQRPLPRRG